MKSIKITPLREPAKAKITIPGSKSYTNRALLLAALTSGTVRIKNPLVSDDTHAMIACLRELGISCSFKGDSLEVSGNLQRIADRAYNLNANLSGTTIRFILALACIVPGEKTIRGRGRLNERPIAHLIDGLRQLGASIEYVEKEGFPPVRVLSSKLNPGNIKMKGDVSSQFLSALLMVAPLIGEVTIEVDGEQVSRPYIEMTIDAMRAFGVTASHKNFARYTVPASQTYKADSYKIEGDVSSASYFFAISTLTKSTFTLANLNPHSVQADMRFLKILERMGSKVEYGEDEITITGGGTEALTVDMQDCPDQAQTLAVLAAFAPGITTIKGIQSLRIKETERVAAVERELGKMGINTESTPDTLVINGGNPKPASIDTYGDHRLAMAFAVAGTALPGMQINDPDVVSKTYPNFWNALESVGVGLEFAYDNPNIVLIGMRGGGKTTVGRLLAGTLKREFVELDELVEKQAGMSIPEIVEKHGWEYFRDMESEIVQKVSSKHGAVISTGGGVIIRPENMAALKENGYLIFLSTPVEILASRIEHDLNRPSLTGASSPEKEIATVLAERKKLYEAVADVVLKAGNLTPTEKADIILQKLKEK
ncbi:MAG: 3-phosphoshikimate 1-carboxyvinyltransferase, partial [Candidatus Kaiserbacteria bacterium]|nr:3-phosphoshikimate 1-carboxyvinyltransferase [Candidatus Kaiserbacteria bacterium]